MRLIAGLLLALGPFFIAFLLFEGTRGLFVGWIRALAAAALGALGTAVVLGVELAFLEPRLAELIALRTAGQPIPGAAIELFVIALVFTLVLIAMLVATARVALGFRMPAPGARPRRSWPRRCAATWCARHGTRAGRAGAERSRAAQVVDAVAASQRRESARRPRGGVSAAGAASDGQPSRRIAAHAPARDLPPQRGGADRSELSPPHARRISASAGRRDRDS